MDLETHGSMPHFSAAEHVQVSVQAASCGRSCVVCICSCCGWFTVCLDNPGGTTLAWSMYWRFQLASAASLASFASDLVKYLVLNLPYIFHVGTLGPL